MNFRDKKQYSIISNGFRIYYVRTVCTTDADLYTYVRCDCYFLRMNILRLCAEGVFMLFVFFIPTKLTQDELLEIIGKYDGLVVRSGVTVDEDLIAAAKNMRIVGRAGTGEIV